MLELKTVTNRWPAYEHAFRDSNLSSRRHARPRQRWLILASLDGIAARMPIFYFQFEARPKKPAEAGGAFINCWIDRATREEAESHARDAIANQDWSVTRLEEAVLVTRETQSAESRQYFDQAEIDGEVFVFHTWPVEAQDHGTSPV